MHKHYDGQPLLALPRQFVDNALTRRSDMYIPCSFNVEPLSAELFGARLINEDKLLSVPYLSALGRIRQGPEIQELSEFARSPEAHEAIGKTILNFNIASEQLYRMTPQGLSRRNVTDLLCFSDSYYRRMLRSGVDLTLAKENAGTKEERIFLPPKGLQELFVWEFPESYPQELIDTHPKSPAFEV